VLGSVLPSHVESLDCHAPFHLTIFWLLVVNTAHPSDRARIMCGVILESGVRYAREAIARGIRHRAEEDKT
jgi:hypothetical protein